MCRISTKTSLLAKNNVVLPSNEGETGNLALLHQKKCKIGSKCSATIAAVSCMRLILHFFVHVVLHQALTKKLERIFQFHFLRKRYMFTVTSAYSTYISKQGRVLPVASRCCKEKCIPLIVFWIQPAQRWPRIQAYRFQFVNLQDFKQSCLQERQTRMPSAIKFES